MSARHPTKRAEDTGELVGERSGREKDKIRQKSRTRGSVDHSDWSERV